MFQGQDVNNASSASCGHDADSNALYASGDYKMPDEAFALRPVRFLPDNELRYYSGVTFPRNPKGACDMYYRRCRVFGGIAPCRQDEVGLCDVLDEHGDVIDNFPLNAKGLKYLIKFLKCRVDE
jgi:hypothetical protein